MQARRSARLKCKKRLDYSTLDVTGWEPENAQFNMSRPGAVNQLTEEPLTEEPTEEFEEPREQAENELGEDCRSWNRHNSSTDEGSLEHDIAALKRKKKAVLRA